MHGIRSIWHREHKQRTIALEVMHRSSKMIIRLNWYLWFSVWTKPTHCFATANWVACVAKTGLYRSKYCGLLLCGRIVNFEIWTIKYFAFDWVFFYQKNPIAICEHVCHIEHSKREKEKPMTTEFDESISKRANDTCW